MKNFHFDVFTIFRFEFHVVARVFSKEHVVTDLQEIFGIHLVFADAAGAECDDDAFLWFFRMYLWNRVTV
jgi:hypothetical protein